MASAPRQQDRWSTPRGGEEEPESTLEAMTRTIFVMERQHNKVTLGYMAKIVATTDGRPPGAGHRGGSP